MNKLLLLLLAQSPEKPAGTQAKAPGVQTKAPTPAPSGKAPASLSDQFPGLEFRNIGPFRGGRVVAVTGVRGQPLVYYFGGTGGGVWKTTDGGASWKNISDSFFRTSSIGAVAVAESFLTTLADQQSVTAAQTNLQRREVFAKTVHVLADNELRPGADAARADAELAAARILLLQAQGEEQAARSLLAALLGDGSGGHQDHARALFFHDVGGDR